MFAPRVAKPQTKSAPGSNTKLAHERSTLVGPRYGDGAVEESSLLQQSSGNQATLRQLAQRVSLIGNGFGAHENEAGPASLTAPKAAPWPSWDFSKIPLFPPGRTNQPQDPFGWPRLPHPIQAKLAIGQVDDPLEPEADRIADQVMRMPAPEVSVAAAPQQISRKCDACEEEEKLQTKPAGPEGTTGHAPASVHEVLRSSGQPLDAATRAFMEPRFGQDFSGVRVHTGAAAEQSARDVNANAYTVGHDVVFGAGRFAPGTHEGRSLLAHELTHVVQRESNRVSSLQREEGDNKDAPKAAPKETPKDAPKETPKVAPKETPKAAAATPCVPKFKSLKAVITGSVGVRETEKMCLLMLGTLGKANGVTVTSTVDVPAGCTGTLQYVQLVDSCRSAHLQSGKDIRRKTGGDWIDTKDPADTQQVSKEGSVEFKTSDSPFAHISGGGMGIIPAWTINESFKIWLMWKPDQPANAARVPLAMATWNWSGKAETKNEDVEDCAKHWSLAAKSAAGGTGMATKDSPAATKTYNPGDPAARPADDEGTC